MGQSRVPSKDGEFDQYIRNTTEALGELGPPPAFERLGFNALEHGQWDAFNARWIDIYPKYTNVSTRTSTITAEKNAIKAAFTPFASNLLNRMTTLPGITQADRDTFNIHERDTTPTKRGKIDDTPVVQLEPTAVATVKIRVRTSHDAARSSIHPLADGVEIRYALVAPTSSNIGSGDSEQIPAPTSKTIVPTMPDEAPLSYVSTKALFLLELPETASGKRLYGFLRWINQTDPRNSGPWTTVMQTNVL